MRVSRDTVAQGVIEEWIKDKGIKKRDFGRAIGMAQQAGYVRYHNPSRLSVEDLRNMKLTEREILQIVNGKKYEYVVCGDSINALMEKIKEIATILNTTKDEEKGEN